MVSRPIDIDSQRVLRHMGYSADYQPPARISSLVADYVANARYLIDPSYAYVIRNIELVYGHYVIIEGLVTFESGVVARLLERGEGVAVFVATIGGYLEETVHQLAEDGRLLQAMVLDAIGSVAAEGLVTLVQDRLGAVASGRGLYASRCFSPGYCDWAVEQQRVVFQVLNGDTAGVQLTEGCLMLPRKSVSGIVGIGPADVESYHPCPTCDRYECAGRR